MHLQPYLVTVTYIKHVIALSLCIKTSSWGSYLLGIRELKYRHTVGAGPGPTVFLLDLGFEGWPSKWRQSFLQQMLLVGPWEVAGVSSPF